MLCYVAQKYFFPFIYDLKETAATLWILFLAFKPPQNDLFYYQELIN